MQVNGWGCAVAVVACVCGAGAAACSKDLPQQDDFAVLYRPCSDGTKAGTLTLTFNAPLNTGGYSMFAGKVFQTPLASGPPVGAREGDCAIISGVAVPLCWAYCTATDVCTGTCPPTGPANVGTIQIAGLTPPLTIEGSVGPYQTSIDTQHFPPARSGASLTLSAAGGYHEAFALSGRAITAVRAHTDLDALHLAPDQPLTVTWEDPGQPGPARVIAAVYLSNSYPGATASPNDGRDYIRCEFADTGSGIVPASLLATVRAQGVGQEPVVVVTRRTVNSMSMSLGCVEFAVESTTSRNLTLD